MPGASGLAASELQGLELDLFDAQSPRNILRSDHSTSSTIGGWYVLVVCGDEYCSPY